MSDLKGQDLRDTLRTATLGQAKVFEEEEVVYNYNSFIIRQPSIKTRAKINQLASIEDQRDIFLFTIWCVIYCTYDSRGENLVFEEGDFDTIMNHPTGTFCDLFGNTAIRLMRIDFEEKKTD